MEVITLSKGRSKLIGGRTLTLFPTARIVVPEAEYDEYKQAYPGNEIISQEKMSSLGAVYDYCIEVAKDEAFFIADDDLVGVFSLVGRSVKKYTDPNVAMQIIENAALIAKGVGARFFGFNNSANPMYFVPQDPIRFTGPAWSAVGYIGKDYRYDHRLNFHLDIEIILRNLLRNRIVYIDDRFCFLQAHRSREKGGNTRFRGRENSKREVAYLRQIWGDYLRIGKEGDAVLTRGCVKRRQS